MLPRLDASVVAPLTPAAGDGAGAAIGDGRQAAFQRALQGLVGQSVTAEVMSKFKDGSFLVKVADNAVRMMLPPGTQVGAEVPLTVLTANPRPTFQVGNGSPGSGSAVLYTDAGAAEGADAASPAPLPSQGSAVYLPGNGRPPAGTVPGQAGPAGQPAPAAGTPAGAAPAADGDLAPGQAAPGATPGNPAAPAGVRPGLPGTGVAPGSGAGAGPAAGAADASAAGPAGRPAATAATGTAAGATTAPPAAAAAAANPAAALAPGQAATAAAAGQAGAAVPADAVKPQSLAATLLGKAPLTPANELPDLDPNTPTPTLSPTARALTSVLGTVQTGQAAQLALIGKTALFGNAAPDPDQLAQKLHDSISQSGLFYESHVTQWVKGERTLPELLREPQMQRMAQGENAARAAAGGPDLSAAQMINQQLHTQEQGRVQWHGQAWPGQPMQWEIRREQGEGRKDDGSADGEPEQVWRSGVRFRFPMLGAVSASVTLIGGQVHIQVQADSDDTADTLRAYAGRLEGAMEAAGAPLSSLTISQEDRHDG
jgi:hypothetical protein